MTGRQLGKPQSCLRVRSESAHGWLPSSGKTEDNIAYLRGPVSGGAEKNNRFNNHRCSNACFFGEFIALQHSMLESNVILQLYPAIQGLSAQVKDLSLMLFQKRLHPVNSDRALHARNGAGKTTDHACACEA
jgi:hypothetical protein